MTGIPDVTDDVVDSEEIEELLDHAEAAFNAAVLSMIAFSKGRDISIKDWAAFAGSKVAPTWGEVKGQGARDVARLAALNIVAIGGEVHELSGDDSRAELKFTWPDAEDLELFDLTREDVDPFLSVYAPVAKFLELNYAASRSGDVATVVWSL